MNILLHKKKKETNKEKKMKYKIGIIGTGFVGTAVSTGFKRFLREYAEVREHDKYKDSESLDSVVGNSDYLFMCLPTPLKKNGECDTSILESSILEINDLSKKEKCIIIKSTVPPGTTKGLSRKYKNHCFVFNPEFLTQKNFIDDFLQQDRIILGYAGKENFRKLRAGLYEIYKSFTHSQCIPANMYETDSDIAEMVKYMANCFLATKVAYCNEIYQICKASKIDYDEVSRLVSLDKRIGKSHIRVPGDDGLCGFGGACLPKDINALISFAKSVETDSPILQSVWNKNLQVREKYDWKELSQVTGKYEKKTK